MVKYKILLAITLLIFSLRSMAQPAGNPIPIENKAGTLANYYNYNLGGIKLGSIYFSLADTTGAKPISPAFRYWLHTGVDTAMWGWNMSKWTKFSSTNTGGGGGSSAFTITHPQVLDGTQLDIVVPHGLASTPSQVEVDVNDPLAAVFTVNKDATNITIHYSLGIIGAFIYTIIITP